MLALQVSADLGFDIAVSEREEAFCQSLSLHRKSRALSVTRCHGLSLSESDRMELNVAICVLDDALAEFRATLVSHMVRIGSNL